jgi:general secretion pathway protein B
MSLILDALRKSENERRRSAVPGLSYVPHASAAPAVPRWAFATMAVLTIALVGLTIGWWATARRGTAPEVAPAARIERPIALPEAPSAATSSPAATAQAPPPEESLAENARPLSSVVTSSTRSDPAPVSSPNLAPATFATSAAPPTPIAPRSSEPTLPSVTALLAEGISVPTLKLELHAYSERPSDRFVFINGRKYTEGERLAEGPSLISIEPNGVVLNQQGRRFLLTPQ